MLLLCRQRRQLVRWSCTLGPNRRYVMFSPAARKKKKGGQDALRMRLVDAHHDQIALDLLGDQYASLRSDFEEWRKLFEGRLFDVCCCGVGGAKGEDVGGVEGGGGEREEGGLLAEGRLDREEEGGSKDGVDLCAEAKGQEGEERGLVGRD